MKNYIIAVIVLVLVGVGIYFLSQRPATTLVGNEQTVSTTTVTTVDQAETIIGQSVQGRNIIAYNFGTGTTTRLLFVGGIHGGYEWNTTLLAYQLIDYLKTNPNIIPDNERISVIPVLNPDGLNKVVGTTTGNFSLANIPTSQATVVAGRFNTNNVDLGRNFDCQWQATGQWQSKTVSGGSVAFSEPESLAFKNYIEANNPSAVVFWYSSAGGVYYSSCGAGILPETSAITSTYAKASGYPAYQDFTAYPLTGDVVNWLAKINIPAVSVLLTNHNDTEWSKNLAGIEAVIQQYNK
jgi:hypothetical protein